MTTNIASLCAIGLIVKYIMQMKNGLCFAYALPCLADALQSNL